MQQKRRQQLHDGHGHEQRRTAQRQRYRQIQAAEHQHGDEDRGQAGGDVRAVDDKDQRQHQHAQEDGQPIAERRERKPGHAEIGVQEALQTGGGPDVVKIEGGVEAGNELLTADVAGENVARQLTVVVEEIHDVLRRERDHRLIRDKVVGVACQRVRNGLLRLVGLSETQQTLVKNGLRGQVRLQVDGQIKTGRDVILMALMGAEEFGFGTSVLIVLGCMMMRKCNLNTCPMGVATQNPELRKHFIGRYEYLVNYFTFLAREVREYLAEMGFRRLNDIVGHTELAVVKDTETTTDHKPVLDFTRLLFKEGDSKTALCHIPTSEMHTDTTSLDAQMIRGAEPAIERQEEVNLDFAIRNTDRAVGATLAGTIALRYGQQGLPDQTINVKFKGSAGQSFGAFLNKGISFKLEGETNDYFAKGLSGGRIAILPPVRSNFNAEDNIIAGNTGLYGATSGELYINGKVGERFGVRNSGAIAVIEGAGDHCCEYMTGGRVVVLGQTGRNFAAGMSGGVAYVWDKNHNFDYFCNMDMVEINLVEEAQYRKELHELIRQHYLYTGSKLARTMLDDWQRYVEDFIQVVPIEYKRVLQEEQMNKLRQKIADMQRDY